MSAQSPVDYDADDDGLIEIEWLEQLDAVRWDLGGDGVVYDEGNAERYFAAFLMRRREWGARRAAGGMNWRGTWTSRARGAMHRAR